jgi:hypothetical protein
MVEHKLLEIFSLEEAKRLAGKDAKYQSTDVRKYISSNTLTYYILSNTWTMIWREFSPHTWFRFRTKILTQGLIPVIKEMQDEATRVTNSEELGPMARMLYSDIEVHSQVKGDARFTEEDHTYLGNVTSAVLLLLRYPKRFSPSNNDIIQRETIADFLNYENRTKLLQRRRTSLYDYVVPFVKEVIKEMYDWGRITRKIEQLYANRAGSGVLLPLSTGAAADSRATLGDKLETLYTSGEIPWYFDQGMMGTRLKPRSISSATYLHEGIMRVSSKGIDWNNALRYKGGFPIIINKIPAVIRAVPKSFKSSRIIAMDHTPALTVGLAIENIFRTEDACAKRPRINLEDQTINQRFAQLGSITGEIATLDASHASDLISKSLFTELFPASYVRLVTRLLPDKIIVNGKTRALQMASTSGNTLTFRHETIVYSAIAQAAVRYYRMMVKGIPYTQWCENTPESGYAWAYGDDTIVSSEAVDVAISFFEALGLKINVDKSYSAGPFRESCGADFFNGTNMSSLYYPRFPIIGTIKDDKVTLYTRAYRDMYRGKIDNSLTMLIDLQKKVFPISYDAARFLASIVTAAYPKVTYSEAGSVCTDLWDYVDAGRYRKFPTKYRIEHTGDRFIPRSDNFSFVKDGDAMSEAPGDVREKFIRAHRLDTLHCYPVVAHKDKRSYTLLQRTLYDWYRYTTFLKTGPSYSDPLLQLLQISDKPMSISEFFGELSLSFRMK